MFQHITRHTLANGMHYAIKPTPGTGTVALLLQVPVGSRHESPELNGIAHFLEHMLFTGTQKWPEAEVLDVIRRRGGVANARTGQEDTAYYLHLHQADLALGLEWLAQVVLHPTLAAEKIEKERQVILAEKGGNWGIAKKIYDWIDERDWGWDVFRAVRRRHWGNQSRLLSPVIGTDRTLVQISYSDVLEFYQDHYAPNRLRLLVVGDVQLATVSELVELYFAETPARAIPPADPALPSQPELAYQVQLHGPSINQQGQLLLAAPIPGLMHPDRTALLLLAELLENTLTQTLRFEKGWLYGMQVQPNAYSDGGYFEIYTTAESELFPQIWQIIQQEIQAVQAGQIVQQHFQAAQDALRGRTLLAMEGNLNLAWGLADGMLYTPVEQPIPDFFADLAALQASDLTRVAQTYLHNAACSQIWHVPAFTPRQLKYPLLVGGVALGVHLLWRGLRRGKRV